MNQITMGDIGEGEEWEIEPIEEPVRVPITEPAEAPREPVPA